MNGNIEFKGSYALLKVSLGPGEQIKVEPGAMVYMRGPIEVQTSTGGVWKALKRTLLGGESFFMNTYISRGDSEIGIAPELPGDIEIVQTNGTLFVQSTSFLASDPQIDMDVSFGGFKSFFSGEGIFLLKLEGYGQVAISSFGGIKMLELGPGDSITIDTGHVVAFDGSVNWNVRTFGGFKSTLFGGEGLVCDFRGPGRVFVQTRNYPAFVEWIRSLVPRETGSR
ncbi:TIGR00266 family protein [Fervidobacterium gondwanense]|uniref:TIGR00266 family protein n=1 Tax=Fervidobacterium gondwanense DSM 13020 TaxID=1121883 RepID=A0A1M7T8S3_FERGO|nr:TIGR00266 family protein [Fervidobacterium gondwanense]SHN67119.1 TIGR00266 family protein [Fervidobacterium gondwanense DSM 13020]